MFRLFLIFYLCGGVRSKCQLYPTNSVKKEIVYCQSHTVVSFPQYLPDTVKYVKQIMLISTLIGCFQMEPDHYENLEYFYEFGNYQLNCSCLDVYREDMSYVHFNSSCFPNIESKPVSNLPPSETVDPSTRNPFNPTENTSITMEMVSRIITSEKDEATSYGCSSQTQGPTQTEAMTTADYTSMSRDQDAYTTERQTSSNVENLPIIAAATVLSLSLGAAGVGALLHFLRARGARPGARIYYGRSPRGGSSRLVGTVNPNATLQNPFSIEMDILDVEEEDSEI